MMVPMKATLLLALLSLWGQQHCGAFVCRPTLRTAVTSRTLSSSKRIDPKPQRMYEVCRRHASMSAPQLGDASSGVVDGEPVEQPSRLSRISRRVRNIIRKAIMGYLPEEEAAEDANTLAKLAAFRGEAAVVDPRLEEDAAMARQAAARVVEASEEDDEDDLLSKDFVQLNIGDKSPMEAEEDIMASLRRRLENGLPPDSDTDDAERQRQLRIQQQRTERSRPANFDGDTAVAELPGPNDNTNDNIPRPPQQGAAKPSAAPKMASQADVERLNRMFGSMGGEPLP